MGKRAEAQSRVSRAEAQRRVVVDEACGDDDRVGWVLVADAPVASPQSLKKAGSLKGSTRTETLKKGMVVVRVQGGMKKWTFEGLDDNAGTGLRVPVELPGPGAVVVGTGGAVS